MNFYYDTIIFPLRQGVRQTSRRTLILWKSLLLAEGHTVGALVLGGVGLMGAYKDLLQGAVVGLIAVMGALGNGALDALVCFAVHNAYLLFLNSALVWLQNRKSYTQE